MTEFAGQFVSVRSEDELKKLVKLCLQEGTPIIPTSNEAGPPILAAEEEHCLISLSELDEIHDYAADDLTITVGVGVKISDIQRIVNQKGQRLAVEVPHPRSLAVGSMLAMGTRGFLATSLGSMADQVLGIRAITGDGRRLHGGGRVVKNVTGYDFVRLLCGSGGSLGIITEATFRLRPLPPTERTFVLQPGSFAKCEEAAQALRGSRHVITALVLVDGAALHEDQKSPLLLVRGEGSSASMNALGHSLNEFHCPCEPLDDDESGNLWQEVRQFPSSQSFHLALRLPPSQVRNACTALVEKKTNAGWGIVADMQRASLAFTLPGTRSIPEILEALEVKELEQALRATAALPDDLADREGRWERFTHPHQGARKIGDRIKIAFDPGGILLPHRPVAGSF